METVRIRRSAFSKNKLLLEKLNRLVSIHSTLSPGLIMSATSCTTKDALYILLTLFEMHIANAYSLIYSRYHPDQLLERRHFMSGLPQLPIIYEYQDQEFRIERSNDYFRTLEFDLDIEVQFEVADE